MKSIFVITLILMAGLASAYTPEQQTALDSMNLGFKLGMAYEKAFQGQNIAEYNTFVDEYNAWVRQHFGEDASLLKSKMNETANAITLSADKTYYTAQPFNASSDLSKFGKKQVYAATSGSSLDLENAMVQQDFNNL